MTPDTPARVEDDTTARAQSTDLTVPDLGGLPVDDTAEPADAGQGEELPDDEPAG